MWRIITGWMTAGLWDSINSLSELLSNLEKLQTVLRSCQDVALRYCPFVLSKALFEQFDTPIRKAIYHLIDTIPHSYIWSDLAEREAFKKLHEAMCKRRLPVIGRESDFMMPRHIPWWQCRYLEPRDVAVNATDAAPDGVRFSLVRFKTNEGHEKPEFLELRDLRVRSRDLYKLWPKV